MKSVATRFLVGASALAAFVASIAPIPASAGTAEPRPTRATGRTATDPGSGSASSEDALTSGVDPTSTSTKNHGYQHTSSTSTEGTTNVQNALCRRTRVCNITQKVIVMTPEKAIQTSPSPTPTPSAAPTVIVTEQAAAIPAPAFTPRISPSPTPTPSAAPTVIVTEQAAAIPTPAFTPRIVRAPLLSLGILIGLNATVDSPRPIPIA
jgi:hypothetical protein